jgi:transposase
LLRTSGRSVPQLASELGISQGSLRNWAAQRDVDEGKAEGLTSAERDELRRLRRENKILAEEREILKKAAAFFATKARPGERVRVRAGEEGRALDRDDVPRPGGLPVGLSRLGEPGASARAQEDARLSARIEELHRRGRGVYGSPRIWSDLVLDDGERIGRKRVERLMRQAGLSGLIVKKWRSTTVRVPGVRVADDCSTATSPPAPRTAAGSRTSPISEPGRAGCIWLPSRTSSAGGSWGGRWLITCAQSSSPTRSRWRSPTAALRRG